MINFIKSRLKNDAILFIPFWITCFFVVSFAVAVPVYLDGLKQLTVINTLKEEKGYGSDFKFTTQWMPMIQEVIEEKQLILDDLLEKHFSGLISNQETLLSSQKFYWGFENKGIDKSRLSSKASFITVTELKDNIRIIEGSYEKNDFQVASDRNIKVLIHDDRKNELNISIGDDLNFLPLTASSSDKIKAVVVGSFVIEKEEFLMGMSEDFLNPKPTEDFEALPLPLLVSETVFFEEVEPNIRGLPIAFWSFVSLNKKNIERMRSGEIINRIQVLETNLKIQLPQIVLLTQLDTKLAKYNRELFFIFIPILIILSIVLGFGITILLMFSFTTTLKRQIDSMTLVFRGAKKINLLKFLIYEWLPVSLFIIMIAPLITIPLIRYFISSILINMNILQDKFPITYQWNYFLLSTVSMIGCVLLVIISFFGVKTKQNNLLKISGYFFTANSKPFFQRYFLDILFVILGFALIWETRIRIFKAINQQEMGSFGFELRMITLPLMLMLIFAIIFLRVFPIILMILERLIRLIQLPFWSSFGITQISRNPYWYSWLMLIFIFSISGTLAISSIHRTMETNRIQKVAYETLSDVRLIESSPFGIKQKMREKLEEMGGIEDFTSILRTEGSLGTTGSGNKFEILALEPQKISELIWFRDDFGEGSIDDILGKLYSNETIDDLMIPENMHAISVTAKSDREVKNTFLWIVLKGNDGRLSTVTLGPIRHNSLFSHTGELSKVSLPAKILAVQVYQPGSEDSAKPFELLLKDIELIDFNLVKTKLISFSSDKFWAPIPSSEGLDTTLENIKEGIHLDLGVGSTKGVRGIFRTFYQEGIPVLVDQDFLINNEQNTNNNFVIYTRGSYVPVIIKGFIRYFPTSGENYEELMIFDIEQLTNFLELIKLQVIRPNEIVAKVNQNSYEQTISDMKSNFPLAKLKDRKTLKEKSLVTPLAIVGWKGISAVAFWVVLILALIGYYGFSIINQEVTKTEKVILGTLGVSRRNFLLISLIEQLLLLTISLVIGLISGILFGKILNGIIISLDYKYLSKFPEILIIGWFELIVMFSLIVVAFVLYLFRIQHEFSKIILSEDLRLENK